jgi:BirA family transcriptional regulator, biotin operon repressor / biotin---[acetyl-CoA-carboxylase] ligase
MIPWQLIRLGTVASTNDEAMARARAGAAHGTVVVADAQTRGRGRQGRAWHSPPGESLYLSAVLRLPLSPAATPPVTLAAGVAVREAMNHFGARSSIKWPNDVHIAGRKVAGILTETSTRGERLDAVILGIGVNVDNASFPAELAPIATSLRLAVGHPVDREAVLGTLLDELARWIDVFLAEGTPAVARAWRARTDDLGRRLRVVSEGRAIEGIARDLDDEGALWIDCDDGRAVRVLSGEVVTMETNP